MKKIITVGIIKSFIFGFTYLLVSRTLQKIAVWDLLAYRFLAAGITFFLFRLFGLIKVNIREKKRSSLLWLSLFQPLGYYIFETVALSQISSLLSGIIVASTPLAVMALEQVVLKEKNNLKQKAFLFLSTGGVILIAVLSGSDGVETTVAGLVFILLAVFSDACYTVCSRKASETFTPTEMTYFMMLSGAFIFNIINVIRRGIQGTLSSYFAPLLDMSILMPILYLGILASAVGYLLYNYMLSQTQASHTVSFAGLITLISIFAGVFINHEIFRWYHMIGTVCILLGVWGVTKFKEKETDKRLENR